MQSGTLTTEAPEQGASGRARGALSFSLLLAAFWLLPLVAAVPGVLVLLAAALGKGKTFARPLWPAIGILAATAISVATSIQPAVSWPNWLLVAGYLSTIWVVGREFRGSDRLELGLAALFWGMVPWAALGIVFSLAKLRWDAAWGPVQVHLGTWDQRANSIFLHPNILSGYLIFAIGAGLALARDKDRWRSVGPGLAVLAACQVLTQSRSGWVGTLALLSVYATLALGAGLVRPGGVWRRGAWLKLALGLAAVGVAAPFTWSRLATMLDPANASNRGRLYVWESAREMIAARPLFGWGPGTWSTAYQPFHDPAEFENLPHAHDIFLHLGAEYGLVMAVCFFGLVGHIAWQALRAAWDDAALRGYVFPLVAALAGYLVMGLFEFTLSEGRNAIAFFAYLGFLVTLKLRPAENRELP